MRGSWALGAADFSLGSILIVALIATLGALAIHWLRSGPRRSVEDMMRIDPHAAAPAAAADPSRPDWSQREPVSYEEAHLSAMMRDYAARAGIPERVLPKADLPDGADGNFVFRDKFGYVYATWEGGRQTQEYTSAVADQLLFAVFRDRAWMHAYTQSMGDGLAEPDRTRQVEAEQERLLSLIDPRWGAQLRAEREREA